MEVIEIVDYVDLVGEVVRGLCLEEVGCWVIFMCLDSV